jgi:hypothetical protein
MYWNFEKALEDQKEREQNYSKFEHSPVNSEVLAKGGKATKTKESETRSVTRLYNQFMIYG